MVLAEAGLAAARGSSDTSPSGSGRPGSCPAVGQGALGIECRADDAVTLALLAPLDDPGTHRAVLAERRALAELEGGCMIPMAAWARDTADGLTLDAAVFDPEGRERVFASLSGPPDDPDDSAAASPRHFGGWGPIGSSRHPPSLSRCFGGVGKSPDGRVDLPMIPRRAGLGVAADPRMAQSDRSGSACGTTSHRSPQARRTSPTRVLEPASACGSGPGSWAC